MPLPKDSGMIHDHIQRRVLDHEQGAANSFDRVCRTQCHIRDENTQIIVTIPTRGAVGIGAKQVYFFSIHCFRNDLADMGQFLFHFNRHPQHLLAEFIIPCGRTLSNLIFMIPEPRHSGNPSYLPMVCWNFCPESQVLSCVSTFAA